MPTAKRPPPRLLVDARRLAKHAAALGAILAVLCHLLPPDYRPICEKLHYLCSLGGSD